MSNTPRWLRFLERKCQWLAVPNMGLIFVTLQVLGFLMTTLDPIWVERLALIPDRVFPGGGIETSPWGAEPWRLITFLAIPIADSPFWLLLSLWFTYFILGEIEQVWGAFKTTFYILVSWFLTVVLSLTLNYPVTQASDFASTLFLAAAALFPEFEVLLFFVIPVKMKWLGWVTLFFLGIRLIQAPWAGKLFLLAIYSNYLLFFGPEVWGRIKQYRRRRNFK
jgi:hypothetical protein